MRKSLMFFILATAIATLILFAGLSVSATEYADTLRVGICYGSGAVQSIDFESEIGFSVGYSSDRNFYPLETVENTSVTASMSTPENHHLLYSTHTDVSEMAEQLEALKDAGFDVFPAYSESSYCILGGTYSTLAEAQTASAKLSVEATPVALSEKALVLTDKLTKKIIFVCDSSDAELAVFSADTEDPDALISISGSAKGKYRGGFECTYNSSDKITLVNIVPVESYLYSVVCREMSPSWHLEALKVQAVCARNFALSRIGYHKQYGFDVCRTVCCQAYSSDADQSENVHRAVDETRGELLFYEDQLVQAVYSSSMGSSTENVKNVWGSNFPYLVSVDNPYEDTENIYNGKWTKTLTKARATEIMSNSGYDVGTVTEIKALEYTDAGRVLKLLVRGTKGEHIFQRESCRTIFSEATYSQKYTVSSGGATTYPTVRILGGGKAESKELSSVAVLSGKNTVSTMSDKFVTTNGTTTKTYSVRTVEADPDTYVFTGEGWGHGVGMSQYGAKGMAEAGFDYEDILTHYYTGTHLEQAY